MDPSRSRRREGASGRRNFPAGCWRSSAAVWACRTAVRLFSIDRPASSARVIESRAWGKVRVQSAIRSGSRCPPVCRPALARAGLCTGGQGASAINPAVAPLGLRSTHVRAADREAAVHHRHSRAGGRGGRKVATSRSSSGGRPMRARGAPISQEPAFEVSYMFREGLLDVRRGVWEQESEAWSPVSKVREAAHASAGEFFAAGAPVFRGRADEDEAIAPGMGSLW